jgi:hypothetical protein
MDYVSPFDDAVRAPVPPAARPPGVAGRRVALLDIAKARGDELLGRLEVLLRERGAAVERHRKPAFSRPAPAALVDAIARRCDVAVVALAD